ncbi:MAG TPA: ROK family protein [Bacteroidota bacterium]|nr:ROK family protein [Bacteroidota bacterium]
MSTTANMAAGIAVADIVAGVDLGGTNTSVGLVDGTGRQLVRSVFPTRPRESADDFVRRLAGVIGDLTGRLPGGATVRGIGIASPAANGLNGTIESPANLGWGTVNIRELVRRHLGVPVAVANDANAALAGEWLYGAARGMSNVIMLTLGTGLGAGIAVDGRIIQGQNGAAGEFGHVTADPAGRMCGCGRRGCVETYVSASGLRRTVAELLADRLEESVLRDVSFRDMTAAMVARLAGEGDEIALEAVALTGKHLGLLVANLAATFDPEAVILYGGLVNAGELLLAPARASFEECALGLYRGRVRILVSSLNNGEAAVLGASSHVRDLLAGISPG